MKIKSTAPVKGRILRVKKGFNPNSSSISSDIIVFFTTAAAVTALFAVAAGIVMARFSDKPETSADADRKQTDK
jgi:hypothetical protein